MMDFLKEEAHFKEVKKTDFYQDYSYSEGGNTYYVMIPHRRKRTVSWQYASESFDTDSLKDMPVWFQDLYWKADKEFEKKKRLVRLVNHEE